MATGTRAEILVRLPPRLKELAEDTRDIRVTAATVGEALDNVIERYPGMRARLRAAGGELRSSVLFFLNSEDIRARDGEATPVAAGDELAIVPIVEGG